MRCLRVENGVRKRRNTEGHEEKEKRRRKAEASVERKHHG